MESINLELATGLQFEDVDHRDYPDYCDAYVSAGFIGDRELTEDELDQLNDNANYSTFKRLALEDFLH
jgi:hypothetical protein